MSTQTDSPGVLAIWNDCAPGQEALYEDWYRSEHLAERMAVPGFRSGRRFRRLGADGPDFFTYYETDKVETLFSAAYQDRVNNPTETTRRVMADAFINVSRTICSVDLFDGTMHGAFAVTATLSDPTLLNGLYQAFPAQEAIVRTELWHAVPRSEGPPSTEQAIRGQDQHIKGGLLVQAATAEAAKDIAGEIAGRGRSPACCWSLMYEMFA